MSCERRAAWLWVRLQNRRVISFQRTAEWLAATISSRLNRFPKVIRTRFPTRFQTRWWTFSCRKTPKPGLHAKLSPRHRGGSLRSEGHRFELKSLRRNSYAVYCYKQQDGREEANR